MGIAPFVLYSNVSQLQEEIMESETPRYLYKILPLRLWQATQNRKAIALPAEDEAFIHFSREDQLERIVTKYWAEAPQYVVLKIETEKLEGSLVYEANPGGSAKYYHLYEGHIPLNAIVESKVIYQQPMDVCASSQLDIVQTGDPVLRQVARELSVEEILSPEIQTLIQEMKATMRAAPGVGLAAPQIGRSIQLAVIEDVDHAHLTPEQILEREVSVVPFHVIINPRIYLDEGDRVEFFEGCLSISEFVGAVPRARSVRVEYLNEKAEPVVICAKGWYARILQHEIDHLNGVLYVDRALLPTLMTVESYIKLWKGKKVEEIVAELQSAEQVFQSGIQ
jgi:peptide deformylase